MKFPGWGCRVCGSFECTERLMLIVDVDSAHVWQAFLICDGCGVVFDKDRLGAGCQQRSRLVKEPQPLVPKGRSGRKFAPGGNS